MEAPETARVLAALGHEGRLAIFRLLSEAGPLPAGEVARRTGQLQNTASSNLSVLSYVGLVSAMRAGRSIIYSVTPDRAGEALAFLCEPLIANGRASAGPALSRVLDAYAQAPQTAAATTDVA